MKEHRKLAFTNLKSTGKANPPELIRSFLMYSFSALLLYEYLLWLIFTGAARLQGVGAVKRFTYMHSNSFQKYLIFVINIDLFILCYSRKHNK
jgi:hypothetical protein